MIRLPDLRFTPVWGYVWRISPRLRGWFAINRTQRGAKSFIRVDGVLYPEVKTSLDGWAKVHLHAPSLESGGVVNSR
jgi:hypothetical protein